MASDGHSFLSPDGRSAVFRTTPKVLDDRVWCDGCLTSAAVTIGVFFAGSDRQIGTVTRCLRCKPIEAR